MRMSTYLQLPTQDMTSCDFSEQKRFIQTKISKGFSALTDGEKDPKMAAEIEKARTVWIRFINHGGVSNTSFQDNPKLFEDLQNKRFTTKRLQDCVQLFSKEMHFSDLSTAKARKGAIKKVIKAREKALNKLANHSRDVADIKAVMASSLATMQVRQQEIATEIAHKPQYLTLDDLTDHFEDLDEMMVSKLVLNGCRERYGKVFPALEAVLSKMKSGEYGKKLEEEVDEQSWIILSEEGIKKALLFYLMFESDKPSRSGSSKELGITDDADWISLLLCSGCVVKNKEKAIMCMEHFLLEETCKEEEFKSHEFLQCFNSYEAYCTFGTLLIAVISKTSFYFDDLVVCDCKIINEEKASETHENNQCLASKDRATKSQSTFNLISQHIVAPVLDEEDRSLEALLAKHMVLMESAQPEKEKLVHVLVEMCKGYLGDERVYKCLTASETIIKSEFFYTFIEAGMFKEAFRYMQNSNEENKKFYAKILIDTPLFIHQCPNLAVELLDALDLIALWEGFKKLVDSDIFKKDLELETSMKLFVCMDNFNCVVKAREFVSDIARIDHILPEEVYTMFIQKAFEDSKYDTAFFLLEIMKSKTLRKKVCKDTFKEYKTEDFVALFFTLYKNLSRSSARIFTLAIISGDKKNRKELNQLAVFCNCVKPQGRFTDIAYLTKILKKAGYTKNITYVKGLLIYFMKRSEVQYNVSVLKDVVRSAIDRQDKVRIYEKAKEILEESSREEEVKEVQELLDSVLVPLGSKTKKTLLPGSAITSRRKLLV